MRLTIKFAGSALLLVSAFALAGCATHPCQNFLPYHQAKASPQPVIPDGLTPIKADPAFKIPPGKVQKKASQSRATCKVIPPTVIQPDNPPKTAG